MTLEVELEAFNSINTSKLKTRGRSALLTWEHTHLLSNSEPVRNKKACLLLYCKYCIKLYAV